VSARDDLLGRATFAETLARAIRAWHGEESLTIAVSGDWGSGKTSLKNMVVECLRKNEPQTVEIVEFNPWKWDTQDKISAAFYREVGIALKKVDRSAQGRRRVRRWRSYGRVLTFGSKVITDFSAAVPALFAFAILCGLVGHLVSNATADHFLASFGIASAALAAFLRFGGSLATKLATMLGQAIEDYEQRSLEESKQELADDLRRLDRSVLVIIDDLDSITKTETRSVIQHIKVNADFPHLIYFLLYYQDIVATHLEEPPLTGKEFLEKIVQLPFDIPALPLNRVHNVLFTGLSRTIERLPNVQFDERRWSNLFLGALAPFFGNLRCVNRFLSTFSVHAELFRSARAFEVNIIDLIAIEAVRVFEPRVYSRMASAKPILTSGARRERGNIPAELQAIFDEASVERRESVSELLKQLFPPIEAALGGVTYDGNFQQRWRDELRVCSQTVFERYFQFGIPEGDLSESEFRDLLDATASHSSFVKKFEEIQSRNLLDPMLQRLDDHAPNLPLANAQPTTRALMDLGDRLPDGGGGFLMLTPDIRLLQVIVRMLGQEASVTKRGVVVLSAMRETIGLLIPSMVIASEKEDSSATIRCLDDDQLVEAKAIWLKHIESVAEEQPERLLTGQKLVSILYKWNEWSTENGPTAWIPKLIDSREQALKFIAAATLQSSTYRSGDHVAQQHSFIRLSDIETFISVDQLARYIDAGTIDVSRLNTAQAKGLQAFREALQRRAEGKPDDSFFHR
jgi:predicted KAP-like P-loop ATPase